MLPLVPTAFVVFLGISFCPPVALSNDWSEWQEAKNLYDSQKYEPALLEMKSHPRDNSNYYYNLGTIYFRLNRLGPAVAHLEKAKQLKPNDSDIRHNLMMARDRLARSVGNEKLEGDGVRLWGDFLFDPRWQTLVGLLGIFFVALWIFNFQKNRKLKDAFTQPLGATAFLGILSIGGVFCAGQWSALYPLAVSLEKQTIRSGPGDQFMELSQAYEGALLRVLGPETQSQLEVWRQVRYSQSGVGWVKVSGLLTL